MRYLLILQSLCSEMHGIANWLARQPGNEVMLALERSNHYPDIPNAERILLKKLDLHSQSDSQAGWLAGFMQRAEKTSHTLQALALNQSAPDIILVYSANGSGFNPKANFPVSFVVNYACDLTGLSGNQKKAAELLELMQNKESDLAFAFGTPQSPECRPAPFILDADYFTPQGSKRESRKVVFWLKDRKGAEFLDWIKRITLLCQKGLQCVIFAPNKQAIQEAQNVAAPAKERILMACAPHRSGRKQLFNIASLFVCPSKTPNLDLLEAMACAMPVMAPFGECLPIPPNNPEKAILELLGKPALLTAAGKRNREDALASYSETAQAPGHIATILETYRKKQEPGKTTG